MEKINSLGRKILVAIGVILQFVVDDQELLTQVEALGLHILAAIPMVAAVIAGFRQKDKKNEEVAEALRTPVPN